MFNLQDLMDPVYYPMTKAADSFSFSDEPEKTSRMR